MNFKDILNGVGRGAEDLFTLGGAEVARKYGGQGAANVLNPMSTALGANYAIGGVGGLGMMGAGAMGMGGAGAGAGGASAGAGASPSLSLFGPGTGQTAFGASMADSSPMGGAATGGSPISGALQAMRGMPQQQAPQRQDPNAMLQKIYEMYPMLKPGSSFGGFGG